MKRKTKSHVKVIMLLFIALLMFNCQNDENSSFLHRKHRDSAETSRLGCLCRVLNQKMMEISDFRTENMEFLQKFQDWGVFGAFRFCRKL